MALLKQELQLETVIVGLGEMQVSKNSSVVLACLGLVSCIGVCAYDPVSKVAGMAHIVLPSSEGRDAGKSPKYADTAIPALVDEMCKIGANERRLIVKISGGAQMSTGAGSSDIFKTGERNAEATKATLSKHGIRLVSSELGGKHGRTVRLYVDSGRVSVATAGSASTDI